MFEGLTERLGKTFRNLTGTGKLTEANMAEALKEVRSALLSADVHFKVAREFIEKVKAGCVGEEVLQSVSPGQQVVKVINDEMVELLGGESPRSHQETSKGHDGRTTWLRQDHKLCQTRKASK